MLNENPGGNQCTGDCDSEENRRIQELLDIFTLLFNRAAAVEREPVDIGGVLIYSSEVHLIDLAARYPEENLSELAERLGVTKGAVSQNAIRLEKKGYLERTTAEKDRRHLYIRLTPKGEEAFEWHRRYHEAVNAMLAEELLKLDNEQIANLKTVLIAVGEMLENCPEVRKKLTENK